MSTNFENKSIDSFLEQIKSILNLGIFKPTIDDTIAKQYSTGINELDKELKLPFNLVPSDKDVSFLQSYINDNIKKAGDDIADNIRAEIQRGILNQETTSQLAKRIKLLFREKKYQTRLKTIIRTETLRANNHGILEGANQVQANGIKVKKWLDVTRDNRTSNICKHEYAKYGTKDQAIDINKEFIVKANNKTIKSKSPPFHPNCRSVLRIVRV